MVEEKENLLVSLSWFMRNKLVTILIILSTTLSFSQKIDSLEHALDLHEEQDSIKVRILNQLGYEYWIVNPIQSIIYGEQAKAIAKIINDQNGLAFSNRVIGVANWTKGSYDHGLSYLFEGLELYKSLDDTLGEANCLMNVGLIYADRNDYDRALEFYFDALTKFELKKADGRSATTYTKIASIFIDQGNYEAARDFLRRSLNIHKYEGFKYGQMEAYNRLGLWHFKTGSIDSANLFLMESLDLSQSINDVEGKTKTLLDLANIQLSVNNLAKAEEYLNLALTFGREINSHKRLKEIYEKLQIIYRRRGDLNKAIFYYDQYIQERDSLFNEEMVNNIARLESQLATVEQQKQIGLKEQEIIILQQETALQQTRIVILIVAILGIAVISILVVRSRQARARHKEQKAEQVAQKAEHEIEQKNRELSSYTVNFVQKNKLFEDLIESIQEIKKRSEPEVKKDLAGIEKIVKRHIKVDEDWNDFKMRFEHVHKGFFDQLHEKFPSLTNNDLRLSVLVKMNFSIKEISDMFGISPESVKTARYRLKKKLKLPSEQKLDDFINEIA